MDWGPLCRDGMKHLFPLIQIKPSVLWVNGILIVQIIHRQRIILQLPQLREQQVLSPLCIVMAAP